MAARHVRERSLVNLPATCQSDASVLVAEQTPGVVTALLLFFQPSPHWQRAECDDDRSLQCGFHWQGFWRNLKSLRLWHLCRIDGSSDMWCCSLWKVKCGTLVVEGDSDIKRDWQENIRHLIRDIILPTGNAETGCHDERTTTGESTYPLQPSSTRPNIPVA